MDNLESKNQNQVKKNQKIVVVEAKPITDQEKPAPGRVDNIRIDKIGDLTFNFFAAPLKKRYEKHYKTNKMHLVTDIVLIAIIIILLAVVLNVWLFSRTKLLNQIDFQVTSNPPELVNAQESEFTLNYTNTTKKTMTDVSLVLRVPHALHEPVFQTDNYNTATNTLAIGELAPGAHGQFKVSGLMLGNMNEQHEFLAVINYKNQYGQDRQEFFGQHFQLADSALKINIDLPNKIISSSPFNTKINLENTAAVDLAKLKLKILWPTGYQFTEAELGAPISDQIFTAPDLKAGQLASYAFTGKLYLENPFNPDFTTQIYTTYNGQEFLIAQTSNSTWADFSNFKVSLTDIENSQAVNPGGKATYTVLYKNEENYTVTNIEIGLNVSGEFAANSQVRVGPNEYKKLASIEPGQEGTIELTASAKTAINFHENTADGYSLNVSAFAAYDDPVETSRISVESKPIITMVNSRLSLNTLGIFYTSLGDQIGVGSVPPVVGDYTSYWVVVKAVNTNNPLKDIMVTAQIGPGVEYTNIYNVTEGVQIVYNQGTRTITWQLENLSAFAGIFGPAPEARIQLALIPTSAQVNTSPALLSNISATATDTKTGAFITASGKNISTAIFNDDYLNKVIE